MFSDKSKMLPCWHLDGGKPVVAKQDANTASLAHSQRGWDYVVRDPGNLTEDFCLFVEKLLFLGGCLTCFC